MPTLEDLTVCTKVQQKHEFLNVSIDLDDCLDGGSIIDWLKNVIY
jgi:hypothetical protein